MTNHTKPNAPLVAVTGGAGFIGSHTVDMLVERGCRVLVLDNFSTGSRDNLAQWGTDDRVEIINVDIGHGIFAALAPITARLGAVERIVHLAAQTDVTTSIANPLADLRVNYAGTVHVLEYARATGVRKIVFSSSAAVYGDVTEFPVHEGVAPAPVSPYGIDKLASEFQLRYYAQVHGVSATAFRFFNVYGPRQDPRSPYSGVISIFAMRAMEGAPVTVYGDGKQTRDFIFVTDIARALVAAALSDGPGFAVANLGTGIETSVNELAHAVIDVAHSPSQIEHREARSGEIIRSVAATSRARTLLGTSASESYQVAAVPLSLGLADTLKWLRLSRQETGASAPQE